MNKYSYQLKNLLEYDKVTAKLFLHQHCTLIQTLIPTRPQHTCKETIIHEMGPIFASNQPFRQDECQINLYEMYMKHVP